jgi:hypothetical protein
MRKLSSVVLFSLALVLVSSIGCARKPDDAKISGQIQLKYSQDSGLSSKQISVQSSTGVVTLTGIVENDAQREAAARQAASVDGVKEVVNNLQVASASNTSVAVQTPDSKITDSKHFRSTAPDSHAGKASSRSRKAGGGSRANKENTVAENSQPPAPVQQPVQQNDPPVGALQPEPASAAPSQPLKITIEQGTPISVRLIDSIDSEKNQVGDTFHATLNTPLSAEGFEAIPAGTDVTGHIVDVKSAGKFAGKSVVALQLDTISSNGQTYHLETDQYRKEGSSRGKSTAEKVGGGAIIGGIIGAIAGGGKGAAIGTAAGAGVGGGVQAASKSQQIKLPSETVLNFTLQNPVTVIKAQDSNASRQKLGDSK